MSENATETFSLTHKNHIVVAECNFAGLASIVVMEVVLIIVKTDSLLPCCTELEKMDLPRELDNLRVMAKLFNK